MTRKDYELMAKIIRANADRCYESESIFVIKDVANDLATALKEDNPRFDRVRFVEACGFSV